MVPYTVFSPSHLIDPEFGTMNVDGTGQSDFFDSVLQEDDDVEDILQKITTE